MKSYLLVSLAAIMVLQSGCVVGRRTIALSVPAAGPGGSSRGDICVTSVTDARQFQNKPPQPSTPSIDGDVNTLTAEQKSLMIGRQRNGFGAAMGDIALPAGDSVMQRTKLLVEEALKHRGYNISSDPAAANSAAVTINEFWAWFSPGMFYISFEARVNCTVTLKNAGGSTQINIQGYGLNHGQVASDANWQVAYDRAFKDFLGKFDAEMDKTKF
jgi:hypothetical protein